MTFPSRAPIAGWQLGDVLTSVRMNELDTDHTKAVDGSGGGSYTLTEDLTISGLTVGEDGSVSCAAGLTVGGDLSCQGTLTRDIICTGTGTSVLQGSLEVIGAVIGGTVVSEGALTVNGTSSLNGDADVGGSATVSGGLHVSGTTTLVGTVETVSGMEVGGGLTVDGAAVLRGPSATVANTLNAQGTLVCNGGVNLSSVMTPLGAGRIRQRVVNYGSVSNDFTTGPQNADVVIVEQVTSACSVHLDSSQAMEGDMVTLLSLATNPGYNLSVYDGATQVMSSVGKSVFGPGHLSVPAGTNVGGGNVQGVNTFSVDFLYTGGHWRILRQSIATGLTP